MDFNNTLTDNVIVNSHLYIKLQSGLVVSIVTANDLNAIEKSKQFYGCNSHLCFNCQLQGKLNLQIRDRKLLINQGDLTFGFAAGEIFNLQNSADFCNLEVMIIPELLNELLGEMNFSFSNLDKKIDFFLHHHHSLSKINVLSSARQLYHSLHNTYFTMTNRLLLYAQVLEYLNWYFKSLETHFEKQTINHREYDQVTKARDYLIKDLSNPPTIIRLAKKVGLNQSKLKKVFKEVYGKSIYAYFLTERMHRAKKLLKYHSVTDTAIMMGYSNISHFSSAFRKQFGILPKEARRQS